MAEVTRNDVLAYLEKANMLEVSELIKDIEEKFGAFLHRVGIVHNIIESDPALPRQGGFKFDRSRIVGVIPGLDFETVVLRGKFWQ